MPTPESVRQSVADECSTPGDGGTGGACLVWLTAPDHCEALRLGRCLVEKGLVAGVNIIPGALSIYRWQGKVRQKEEHLLIAQASANALRPIGEHVRRHHPYSVPCVLWIRTDGGSGDFLRWIAKNSSGYEI